MADYLPNNFSSPKVDPLRSFRFLVLFTPHDSNQPWAKRYSQLRLGFTSVSGLSMTTDALPYREGGYNTTVHQIPGMTSFSPITLSRGVVIGSYNNWYWTKQLFNVIGGNGYGNPGQDFRATVNIKVLDHPASAVQIPPVKLWFRVYNAWPTGLAYSDLNAGDNGLVIEQMTLAHEGWDVTWATSPGENAAQTPAV